MELQMPPPKVYACIVCFNKTIHAYTLGGGIRNSIAFSIALARPYKDL